MRFVLDFMGQAAAILVGGATGVFFLALMSRRASPRGIYCGLVSGIAFAAWAVLTGNPAIREWLGARFGWWLEIPSYTGHIWLIALWADAVIVAVGYLSSLLLDPGYRAPRKLTIWGWRDDLAAT